MILIQTEDFSVDKTVQTLRKTGAGAIVTFTGAVRETSYEGTPVISVEWDVYEPMALKVLEAIRREAIEKFALTDAAITHRKGRQAPGENLVLIAAAAAHRRDAFRGCEYIMDEIKKRAPLWKKERLADGKERWIEE
ncbi:MAG: molybdenum cofactor biosynthesis protein MoaE [Candidatus Omnitrophota bacterium]